MTGKDDCGGGGKTHVILACSGASNVGQMANEIAKRLDSDGTAKFFCMAGVGGHVSGMVASVSAADKALVLDGCPVGCGKRTMEAAGLERYSYVVLTQLGIAKEHSFQWDSAALDKATDTCRKALAE